MLFLQGVDYRERRNENEGVGRFWLEPKPEGRALNYAVSIELIESETNACSVSQVPVAFLTIK